VTVHSTGFGWWQRLVDRYNWQIFRRVTKVSLDGPKYSSDLLPELAKLSQLKELELVNTSISRGALEIWQRQHPHVVVTAQFSPKPSPPAPG
jgi:hypothetical protein